MEVLWSILFFITPVIYGAHKFSQWQGREPEKALERTLEIARKIAEERVDDESAGWEEPEPSSPSLREAAPPQASRPSPQQPAPLQEDTAVAGGRQAAPQDDRQEKGEHWGTTPTPPSPALVIVSPDEQDDFASWAEYAAFDQSEVLGRNHREFRSFRSYLESRGVNSLWHMTHRKNLLGILEEGLLCHRRAHSRGQVMEDISDHEVQARRKRPDPIHQRLLHEYVPLFINPLSPMAYVRREQSSELVLLEISLQALKLSLPDGLLFTDGNAAAGSTRFYRNPAALEKLPWGILGAESWHKTACGRRKRSAEFLIHGKIPAAHIASIRVNRKTRVSSVTMEEREIPFLASPELFF